MRKRNNIVFNLVESEREYNHQLEILVANYVRPFRMGKKKTFFLSDQIKKRKNFFSGKFKKTTNYT
jgi:hypothetical protein